MASALTPLARGARFWQARGMRHAFALICAFLPLPALAEMSAAEFEAYTEGKTSTSPIRRLMGRKSTTRTARAVVLSRWPLQRGALV